MLTIITDIAPFSYFPRAPGSSAPGRRDDLPARHLTLGPAFGTQRYGTAGGPGSSRRERNMLTIEPHFDGNGNELRHFLRLQYLRLRCLGLLGGFLLRQLRGACRHRRLQLCFVAAEFYEGSQSGAPYHGTFIF